MKVLGIVDSQGGISVLLGMSITEHVHEQLKELMSDGSIWIDATVGNGHDTLFLAQNAGYVYGLDVQGEALEGAHERLGQAGMSGEVELILCGHESIEDCLPQKVFGNVEGVMFNLGYCPGMDKSIHTCAETTIIGLEKCWPLLREGGYISLVLYKGHEGAQEEVAAVEEWLSSKEGKYSVLKRVPSPNKGPEWILLQKASYQ